MGPTNIELYFLQTKGGGDGVGDSLPVSAWSQEEEEGNPGKVCNGVLSRCPRLGIGVEKYNIGVDSGRNKEKGNILECTG